ncbi:MAG: hypothetical protein IT445_11855 [Phycisphaeraceae bacterium]|nr:hypothetical protein [Phycisphaeraceae bacterium]
MEYTVKHGLLGAKVLYECDHCHSELESPLKDADQDDKCPYCGHRFKVPGGDELRQQEEAAEEKKQEPQVDAVAHQSIPSETHVKAVTDGQTLSAVTTQSAQRSNGGTENDDPFSESPIAVILVGLGCLEIIAAAIVGNAIGVNGSIALGWAIFFSGLFSALVLFGFASIILNVKEAANRLRRIEGILQKEIRGQDTRQASQDVRENDAAAAFPPWRS